MKVRLTTAGKKSLKHGKKVKLTAKGTFVPTGGGKVLSAARTFVIR